LACEVSMRTKRLALIVCLTLGILVVPLVAGAQVPSRVPRIGTLAFGSNPDRFIETFLQRLHQLGHVEGQTLAVEGRYADGRSERLPDLAAELVGLKVNLIFASGTDVSVAVKNATTEVPVVFLASGDPVGVGLVPDLARPGGNVTGVTLLASELSGKRLELLKEIRSKISRVGVLWNPDHLDYDFDAIQASAQILNVRLQPLEVRRADDFEKAYKAAIKSTIEALVVVPTRLTFLHRQSIADFGLRNRIPTISGWSEFADAGGLVTYGPNLTERTERAAMYADKILRGAKPGDLPVEQPTQFELVVNLKTARAIGVALPQALLQRADRVIR
jgi:putative ABC transport system substrate-binding protein